MNLQQLTEVDFEITSAIIKSIPEELICYSISIEITNPSETLLK